MSWVSLINKNKENTHTHTTLWMDTTFIFVLALKTNCVMRDLLRKLWPEKDKRE